VKNTCVTFKEEKYRNVLLDTDEEHLFETKPALAGIQKPYGYGPEDAMDILKNLREELRVDLDHHD
jgi:hypothetical protein